MSSRIGRLSARILNGSRLGRSFQVRQYPTGSRNEFGDWISGEPVITDMVGSIQPATEKQKLQLPEAERISEAIIVYVATLNADTISPLKVGTTQSQSDIIIIDGLEWSVRAVKNFSDFGHLEIIATRIEGQNG